MLSSLPLALLGFTPYAPLAGWTFYLEASRSCGTPSFISSNAGDTTVGLATAHGSKAELTLAPSSAGDGASPPDTGAAAMGWTSEGKRGEERWCRRRR